MQKLCSLESIHLCPRPQTGIINVVFYLSPVAHRPGLTTGPDPLFRANDWSDPLYRSSPSLNMGYWIANRGWGQYTGLTS
jgi:hypothetical protein